jgi:hypothetical protein
MTSWFANLSSLRECSLAAGGNDSKAMHYGSGKAEDELTRYLTLLAANKLHVQACMSAAH